MMLTFIQYVTTSFGVAVFLFFTVQLINSKLNGWKILLLSFSLGLLSLLKVQFSWDSPQFVMMNMLAIASLVCVLIFAYTEKPLKRCMVFFYFSAIWSLTDSISAAIFTLYYGDMGHILSETNLYIPYVSTSIALHIFMGSVSVLLWRMIKLRRFQPLYLLFIVLPVGQVAIVFSLLFSIGTYWLILGVLLCLSADLALLSYTTAREKRVELERELRQIRHKTELEQAHYQELEQRREELAKLRHDFNNQLAAISHLARSGEEGAAQALIESLSREINQ